ncbi:biotin/acetyl-CoA-carboxylase ligase [Stanieria cyanosphaera PCC 7437]|uniref:Biotin/acetyl-CoA-carboxylase ligase n=1 Tax=Stanieria cyanosphaera (strain ATCC 29371 / PCC 7437) TaxID=111780 RepID=K9XX42_STAC7|nr:biotin--[acetyl-CoA-carboxylase] ligase [Stanieria cyanosphaera]AFZ37170.1 biotin/acetyl-CoA-carboxylase ligase [Stanieria cyanosphaera PCC 7437]
MNFDLQKYQAAILELPNFEQLKQIPLQIWETIPSTNQKLWELIEQGEKLPLASLALEQTAGRGQWGRQWLSTQGGLYLSLGIACNLNLKDSFLLTLIIGWGIVTTLRNYNLPILLKWPNDLILMSKKLGGIKLETRSHKDRITQVVIGVGINWTNSVPDIGINLQSYCQNQLAITSLEQLTAITISGIISGYQHYLTVDREQLLKDYFAIFANLGQQVTLNGGTGIITGVTTTGELRVRIKSPGATTEVCLSPGQISLGYEEKT